MSEVYFEFIKQGNFMKVSAIDAKRNIEAVVILPANTTIPLMKRQALTKLKYLISKSESE
jgi:hypothetical protein